MKRIKDKIIDFMTCNQGRNFELEHIRKAIILNLFVFVGDILVFPLILQSFIGGNLPYGLFLVAYFIIVNTGLWYFHRKLNYVIASQFIAIPVFLVVILLLFASKSLNGSSILWAYMFPLFIFFLSGRKIGLIYTLILFIVILFVTFYPLDFIYQFHDSFKMRFVLTWVCVAAFAYIFEAVRNKTYHSFIFSREKQETYLSEIIQQKEEIQAQAELLTDTNKKLEKQNILIKDSISYAKNIQDAMLPQVENMKAAFDLFILFKPRDIVSGDFYWFAQIDNYYFIAAVDCTGHGVPGAFMSMIGSSLLGQIVLSKQITAPSKILDKLHHLIVASLKQKENSNDDGMDVCLCRIEKKTDATIVTFAGAKRPLYYKKQNDEHIEIIKGSRKTIGGKKTIEKIQFEDQQIIFTKSGGEVYLCSDGFADQNNVERQRFGSIKLLKIIDENSNKAMSEQHDILDSTIEKWMQGTKQRDDITVIGVRL